MTHFIVNVFALQQYIIQLLLSEKLLLKHDNKFYVDYDKKILSSYRATLCHTPSVFRSLSTNA